MKEQVTEWVASGAGGANSVSTASQAAPGNPNLRHYVTWVLISCNGQPAAAVTAQIQYGTGPTQLVPIMIPAAAFSPIMINFVKPVRVPEGVKVELTIPALGTGISSTAVIGGYTHST